MRGCAVIVLAALAPLALGADSADSAQSILLESPQVQTERGQPHVALRASAVRRVSVPVDTAKIGGCSAGADVTRHGGSILRGTVGLYHIYLGKRGEDYTLGTTTPEVMGRFAEGLNGSRYANTLSHYRDKEGYFNPAFQFRGNQYVSYSSGPNLTDSLVLQAIKRSVDETEWIYDPNALYTVFFNGEFNYDGWLSSWCAKHGTFTVDGSPFSYAVVGDTRQADGFFRYKCAPLYNGEANNLNVTKTGVRPTCANTADCLYESPNGNEFADAMVNHYAHVIGEAVTGGEEGYFRDCDGAEIGDLCAWDYGEVKLDASDRHYNVMLSNNRTFMVQQTWRLKSRRYNVSGCTLDSDVLVSGADRLQSASLLLACALVLGVGALLL